MNNDLFILPDFLVVGAMKAGSTTIMDYLVTHQEVGIPNEEINYFDKDSNFEKGVDWYAKWFKSFSDYRIVGEKTPAYCYDLKSVKRIYLQNPDMKLVWILRDPVKRTYSNYWHYIRIGKELLSFKDCLDLEDQRIKEDIYKGYFNRSVYVNQVTNYLKYFPMSQMHFIFFEEFVNNPTDGLNDLSKFLGITSEKFTKKPLISNKGYKPFSIPLEYYARKWFGYGLVHKITHNFNKLLGSKYPSIDKELEASLYFRFKSDNHRLEKLLNKDLSFWNK